MVSMFPSKQNYESRSTPKHSMKSERPEAWFHHLSPHYLAHHRLQNCFLPNDCIKAPNSPFSIHSSLSLAVLSLILAPYKFCF